MSSLMLSHEITMTGAWYEGAIVDTITKWAKAYPHELVAFDNQMKAQRWAQYSDNGVSEQGDLRLFGEIPVTLDKMMHKRFGNLWIVDPKTRRIFWRHFQVGRINKFSQMKDK